jgi:transcriptional regulator with XRE-family HTH domain
METIGEKIRRIRKGKGLIQKELASRAGITQSALVAIEKNKTKNIFLAVAKGIAKSLNVSFDFLFETDEENKIEKFLAIIERLEGQVEFEKRLNWVRIESHKIERDQLEMLNYYVRLFRVAKYFEVLNMELFTKYNPEFLNKDLLISTFKFSAVEDFTKKYSDKAVDEIHKCIDLDKYIASPIDSLYGFKEGIIKYIQMEQAKLQ